MNRISWDDFYDRFFDLSPSTQKSYSYRLEDFGNADEVFEVLEEFVSQSEAFASRFAEKAIHAGVRFAPDQVIDMTLFLERSVLEQMAETSVPNFDREQLEEIEPYISNAVFERIVRKSGIEFFEEESVEQDLYDEILNEYIYTDTDQTEQRGFGLFGTIIGLLAGFGHSRKRKKHDGRCDGDCANCPPHYGYRYGRWYYGHDHVHGCEFGGNKCSSSID